MFQPGEQVFYGGHGVCRIVDLEKKLVDRKTVEYYVLEPVHQPGSRYYIPTQNQAAVKKLHQVITAAELEQILGSADVRADVWIQDENQRKLRYRDLLGSGDRTSLLAMVDTLYRQRDAQTSAGRKFHQCDENFLKDARKLLESEFSVVLNIRPDQVEKYIQSRLNVT